MNKKELELQSYDELIDHLLAQPMAKINASKTEITMRCPYCGDSNKNAYSTNFYINIDKKSDSFLCYNCFRASCGASGIVDSEFLDRVGFTKYECIRDIESYNKSRTKKGSVYKAFKHKEISNVIDMSADISNKKLDYINNRLGLSLSFNDLYKLKINLNAKRLFAINEINIPKSVYYKIDDISNYGISFISMYNDYLITRDISKSGKLGRRYINTNIFDNYDDATKIYSIPTSIDLLSPEPTVINIAEGAFDILGVYYNLNIDRKYRNQLFLAACGSGITKVILKMVFQYGLFDLKVNIFSDADVYKDKYNKLKNLKKYLNKFDVTIYYNSIGKDFGVKSDEIKLIKSKLRV